MLKFEIENPEVEEINGTSQRTGKPYQLRKQKAKVALGGEIRLVNVMLDRDQAPYPKGVYRLSEQSFYVGGFGDLNCRLVLEPFAAETKKAS